jgi:hypothetical protein
MYQLYMRVPASGGLRTTAGQDRRVDEQGFQPQRGGEGLRVPTILACADADMAPPSHYGETFKLLDDGLRDGGWMGEGRPKGGHALVVVPGLPHYNMAASALFAAVNLDLDGRQEQV